MLTVCSYLAPCGQTACRRKLDLTVNTEATSLRHRTEVVYSKGSSRISTKIICCERLRNVSTKLTDLSPSLVLIGKSLAAAALHSINHTHKRCDFTFEIPHYKPPLQVLHLRFQTWTLLQRLSQTFPSSPVPGSLTFTLTFYTEAARLPIPSPQPWHNANPSHWLN